MFSVVILATYVASIFYDLSRGTGSLSDSILKAMDQTVHPCDNFYNYSCAGWVRAQNGTESRDDRFIKVIYMVMDRLNDMYASDENPVVKQLKKSCESVTLDTVQKNLDYLKNKFNPKKPITSAQELLSFLGSLLSTSTLYSVLDGDQGLDSVKTILTSFLDVRPYGFGNDSLYKPIFAPFLNLDSDFYDPAKNQSQEVKELMTLLRMAYSDEDAQKIWEFENSYFQIQKPLYDEGIDLFILSVEQLNDISGLDFTDFLLNWVWDGPGHPEQEPKKVVWIGKKDGTYPFLKALKGFFSSADVDVMNKYIQFNIMRPYLKLKQQLQNGSFSCEHTPKRTGEPLLAYDYIAKYFPNRQKVMHDISDLFAFLQKSLAQTFSTDDWMSPDVRDYAQTQVLAMKVFPMYGDDYTPEFLKEIVADNPWLENLYLMKNKYAHPLILYSRGDGVKGDYKLFDMLAVNAWNAPWMNDVFIPAGILQNPFYDDIFPVPVYYARIGAIVGHEISHGFDNNGRNFDEYGNMKNWWDQKSVDEYNRRTQCYINQYNQFSYTDHPSQKVNGSLTLGENIADNQGVKISFLAYTMKIAGKGDQPSDILPQFTNDQLFFISYAQNWCSTQNEVDYDDVHSPDQFRPLGTMQNSPEFAKAFQCEQGTYMNPKDKCELF